ncbi:MAG: hypothetical protein PHD41_00435 [Methanosarcinaceae archaeon]|nr:hypothetical protein [Methanosarcinaceae archaeon]MDD4331818.1 hypothetical protein [Methanosarcinaceae archaeon]MDD4748467.1 hypothetical protein [Methanosarcinaceae archaeon]
MYSFDTGELDEYKIIEAGIRAANLQDTKGVVEAFAKLKTFTIRRISFNIKKEHEIDVKAVIIAMGDLGKLVAEKRMESAALAAVYELGEVAQGAAEYGREALAVKAASNLGSLTRRLAENDMDAAIKAGAEAFDKFGKASARQKSESQLSMAEVFLMQLAETSLRKKYREASLAAVCALGNIGVFAAEAKLEDSVIGAELLLEEVGMLAVREKQEAEAKAVIQTLGLIGKSASQQGLKSSLVQAAWSLGIMQVLSEEEGLISVSRAAKVGLESLKTAGIQDEEQNLERILEIKRYQRKLMERR